MELYIIPWLNEVLSNYGLIHSDNTFYNNRKALSNQPWEKSGKIYLKVGPGPRDAEPEIREPPEF